MSENKLVNSAQLDTDLTSIADAIRIKGGTNEQLQFPTGFVNAVEAIKEKRKYTSSFTLVNDGTMPTITHNLGTDKIAVLIFPQSDTVITPHYGYITWSVIYMPLMSLLRGQSVTLDYTQYNSTKFPDQLTKIVGTDNGFRYSTGNVSPWTSQSGWSDGTFYYGNTVTETTYKYTGTKMAAGSYNVFIWALED